MTSWEPPSPTPSSSLEPDKCLNCTCSYIGCCHEHTSTRIPFPHPRAAAPGPLKETPGPLKETPAPSKEISRSFRSVRTLFRSSWFFRAPKTRLGDKESVRPTTETTATTATTTAASSPYSESTSECSKPAATAGSDGVEQTECQSSPPPPYQLLPLPTPSPAFRSASTLAPIHHSVPYHLSLDHIDCVRQRRGLGPQSGPILITELSDQGELNHPNFVYKYWSSEVIFHAGRFLQEEHFIYLVNPRCNSPAYLAGCPHQSVSVSKLVFREGPLTVVSRHVKAQIATRPPHCPQHSPQAWNSDQGVWRHLSVCTVCHANAVCEIELQTSGALRVQYTCYRDLGRGVKADPNQPKWRPLLTGEKDRNTGQERGSTADGARQWTASDPDAFVRLWHAAKDVGGFGLTKFVSFNRYGCVEVSKDTVEDEEVKY